MSSAVRKNVRGNNNYLVTDHDSSVANTPVSSDNFRKRPRKRRKGIEDSEKTSFVTVKIYGKLAQLWINERGTMSDEIFIKQLLEVHELYKQWNTIDQSEEIRSSVIITDRLIKNDKILKIPRLDNIVKEHNVSDQDACSVVSVEIDQSDMNMTETELEESNLELDVETYSGSDVEMKQPDGIACEVCQKKMGKGEMKQFHILSEHFTLYLKCELCAGGTGENEIPNNLVKIEDFYQHLSSIHEVHQHSCPICGKSISKNDIRSHLIEQHWKSLLCHCNICEPDAAEIADCKSILKAISVRGHVIKRHPVTTPTRVSCDICGIEILPSGMARHMRNVHQNSKGVCDLCGRTFSDVDRHKVRVHNNEKYRFECKTCKKKLTSRWNLSVHMRIHTGEKPFVCEICGKAFCQNVELRLHVKNNHENMSKKNKKIRKAGKGSVAEASIESHALAQNSNRDLPRPVLKLTDSTVPNVATSTENLLHTVVSQSPLSSAQGVYAVIPTEQGHEVLLANVSTEANVMQSVAVLDVNTKDIELSQQQMVWFTSEASGTGQQTYSVVPS